MLTQTSLANQLHFDPTQISYPLRILIGTDDEKYQALYGSLPHTVHIPEAGHTIHLENPTACAKAIENFYLDLLS
jgi:pimeloyl-ACP methyl ester carboxylesterase